MKELKVGLARVSTYNRAQDTSIEAQEKALLDAGCDKVITVRESGFKGPRKGWHELRRLVASGTVKEVICIDQSRLARDGTDREFLEECAVQGTVVRALTGGVIETETVGGFIQASVLSTMNEAYSRQLSLKVKDGLERRKASGLYACGRVPFGYKYDQGRVAVHPDNWPIARRWIEQLLAMEMNIGGFLRTSDCAWSAQGIKEWINRPILRGIVARQKEGVKPLFSAEEWEKAQRLLAHRSGQSRSNPRRQLLLTGLVRCEACGKNLKYRTKMTSRPNAAVRLYCARSQCDWYGRGVAVSVVRAQLIQSLKSKADEMSRAIQQATVAKDREETSAHIGLRGRIAQLEELRASGVPALEKSIAVLREELLELDRPAMPVDWTGLAELFRDGLDDATDEELRAVLLEYVESIVYKGNPKAVLIKLRGTSGSD